MGLIAKAREFAGLLSADPAQPSSPEAAVAAKLLRDQLLVLLNDRVCSIRGAAKYVFAAYPDIVRQVTSAHERRRRAELRAKKAEEAKKPETKKTDETKNG